MPTPVGSTSSCGSAATCDGFGFVEITGEGTDLIGIIALILAITMLVVLLVLTFYGRGGASKETTDIENTPAGPETEDSEPGPAADIAAGAVAAGYAAEPEAHLPEDLPDIPSDEAETEPDEGRADPN